LVQKSLKTELRLKSYKVLKLEGLKRKILELETDFLLNQGLNHNLLQAQGVLCKIVGLIRVHGLWTAEGCLVHGSTVGLTGASGRSAPELGIAATPGHGGLPRRHRRQEGGVGSLAVGSPWAEKRRGGLVAVESRALRRHLVCEVLG
jgi:hypothetical protein